MCIRPATLLITCLLVHLPAAAVVPFSAVYDLSRGMLKLGELRRDLRVDQGGRYEIESVMRATGLVALFADDEVVEVSSGRIESARLYPEHYRYDKDGERKDYELSFDYPSRTVRRSDGASGWSAAMPPGVQDKLSYQVQIMSDLGARPGQLSYPIADRDELKEYAIAIVGEETVDTGIGRFRALRLERGKPGSQRLTTVWCAEALGWIAVRVEHRDKEGHVTTAVLRALDGGPAALHAAGLR